jgi:RNA polymerase sigma-70 factor (ECF subfamily)
VTAGQDVQTLVEHLFRHEAGRILASLVRLLGLEDLDLAEEVLQDSLVQALRTWPFRGIPDNPAAWLTQVAHHRALDVLRSRARRRRKERELPAELAAPLSDRDTEDDQLAMIFACCHPALPPEAQLALTLKAVGGFGVEEIARAFLACPPTIAQRLVRAKRRLLESGATLALPPPAALTGRLDSVLHVLYLMFNEGYSAHQGEDLVRHDLCAEAIRLAQLLLRLPHTAQPRVHALLALFLLQGCRLPARQDAEGNLRLLAEQDRSQWDLRLRDLGLRHLAAAAEGDEQTAYHLQAAIAAYYVVAPTYEETDWPGVLQLYDQLVELAPSPVVALNRAVALAMVQGPEAGLRALEPLSQEPSLESYYLLPAARADLLRQLGRLEEAAGCYRAALAVTCTEPERRFLMRRLEAIHGDCA